MAYLNKINLCTSKWIADYKKFRLLSSSKVACFLLSVGKLKIFREGELTEGVKMEYTKPQATCRALLREKGFLLREKLTFYSVKMEETSCWLIFPLGSCSSLERSIIRSFSGNEVAAILQESKVKDGSVTYLPRIRTADIFPRPAYPGVKIMCPNNFVQRPSRVSFCWVTLRWCFGSILYVNCINSTNEITQVLYRVHIYAINFEIELWISTTGSS